MKNESVGGNLQRLLKLHGDLSISDLARKTKIPQPTLHHIIDGKTKKPRRKALEALAHFFSISIAQLTGSAPLSTTIPESIKQDLKISTIPLIDWDLVKNWNKNKHNRSAFEEIILEREINENAFALQLKDSSMEPLFQERSILIFDPSKIPNQRDFVLVYVEKIDSIIFNRLFIDGKILYVKKDKLNGDAELIKISEAKDKVIATLIEARLQF